MFSRFTIERPTSAEPGGFKWTLPIKKALCFCLLASACVLPGRADTIVETETA